MSITRTARNGVTNSRDGSGQLRFCWLVSHCRYAWESSHVAVPKRELVRLRWTRRHAPIAPPGTPGSTWVGRRGDKRPNVGMHVRLSGWCAFPGLLLLCCRRWARDSSDWSGSLPVPRPIGPRAAIWLLRGRSVQRLLGLRDGLFSRGGGLSGSLRSSSPLRRPKAERPLRMARTTDSTQEVDYERRHNLRDRRHLARRSTLPGRTLATRCFLPHDHLHSARRGRDRRRRRPRDRVRSHSVLWNAIPPGGAGLPRRRAVLVIQRGRVRRRGAVRRATPPHASC